MRYCIKPQEPEETFVNISLESDGNDINLLANGYLVAWITPHGDLWINEKVLSADVSGIKAANVCLISSGK